MKDATKSKAQLVGEILATEADLQRAGDREQAMRTALELAYGMIWHVPVDKATEAGRCASIARLVLLSTLDRAGQTRGIAAAKERILRDRESRTNSRTDAERDAKYLNFRQNFPPK